MRPNINKLPRRLLRIARKVRSRLSGREPPRPADGEGNTLTRLKRFRAYLAAEELSAILSKSPTAGKRMLDIGGAYGIHAGYFSERHPDLQIDLLDTKPGPVPLIHTGPYDTFKPKKPYDVIWASHVVEHLRNPGLFFDQAYRQLAKDGWLCVTVPPLKPQMTLGHLTLWNAGLLLLHLVHAGFDCRQARVATYGYNVSVLVQKTKRTKLSNRKRLPAVKFGEHYFDGDIDRLNWQVDQLPVLRAGNWLQSAESVGRTFTQSGFFKALDERATYRLHYFHAPTGEVFSVA